MNRPAIASPRPAARPLRHRRRVARHPWLSRTPGRRAGPARRAAAVPALRPAGHRALAGRAHRCREAAPDPDHRAGGDPPAGPGRRGPRGAPDGSPTARPSSPPRSASMLRLSAATLDPPGAGGARGAPGQAVCARRAHRAPQVQHRRHHGRAGRRAPVAAAAARRPAAALLGEQHPGRGRALRLRRRACRRRTTKSPISRSACPSSPPLLPTRRCSSSRG